jgi:hypothetical protein
MGARVIDRLFKLLGRDHGHPSPAAAPEVPRETRKQFLARFKTPATCEQAFNFGNMSAYHGHGRLTHTQFFANDVEVRIVGPGMDDRTSVYRAYLAGRAKGKAARARRLARELTA